MKQTDISYIKSSLVPRPGDANKGTFGSLLCICGCYGMAGAGTMALKASLKSGVGLAKMALVEEIYPILAQNVLEAVYIPLKSAEGKISADNIPFLLEQAESSSAVLIGCGMGVSADTKKLVFDFIENCTKPMVLDADALNCIAENPAILRKAKADIIITPHPGEMGRLVKLSAKEVNSQRENIATSFAKEYGVITVLKGAGTVIASPDGDIMINPTGNSGMAKGGSGDVLAGMTGSLLAQGTKPFSAAVSAVYLHGLAGDIASQKFGRISMLPTDTIDCISEAFKALEK